MTCRLYFHIYFNVFCFSSFSKMIPKTSNNEAKKRPRSMPKPPKNHPKSRLGRLLNASRRGVGNKLEKRNSRIIELRGFWEPKTTPWSVLRGVQKPSKFRSFFYTSYLHDLDGLLAPNMTPTTHQNPFKIDVHVRVFLASLLASDFRRKIVPE